ncbi:hypothetical protein IC582_018844 [Cucumis melo]
MLKTESSFGYLVAIAESTLFSRVERSVKLNRTHRTGVLHLLISSSSSTRRPKQEEMHLIILRPSEALESCSREALRKVS